LAIAGPTWLRGGVDMIVDCGRIVSDAPGQRAVLGSVDHVVVVARHDAAGLAQALGTLDFARTLVVEGTVSLVVVGPGRFQDKEIEQALKVSLLGAIPWDEPSAAMACGVAGRPKKFARSNLVSSTRRLVDRMLRPVDRSDEISSAPEGSAKNRVADPSNARPIPTSEVLAATGEQEVDLR
jgi:hypothetical protein